jgi:hypothetical protein
MTIRPDFPAMEQVEKADHEQLARWYRFLPSGETKEQLKIMDRITEGFEKAGGRPSRRRDDFDFDSLRVCRVPQP